MRRTAPPCLPTRWLVWRRRTSKASRRVALDEWLNAPMGDDAANEEAVLAFLTSFAEAARDAAPKSTGAGAASIHAELVQTYNGVYVARVGWDRDHFYMMFHELGTSRMSARPFLRPALDRRYDF
jgi:HK97 gp10 family phage protein